MSFQEKMNAVIEDIKKTSHDVSEASKEMYNDVKTQWEGSKLQAYWNKGMDELKAQYVKLREKSEKKSETTTRTTSTETTAGKVETKVETKMETKVTPKPHSDTPKPPSDTTKPSSYTPKPPSDTTKPPSV